MKRIFKADAVDIPLPDQSVDLVFGSPPYCDARTYGIGAQRDCIKWVDWMLHVTTECMRVSRGPVIWVAAGVTRKRNYWPACEGLMWKWWRRGGECHLYSPCFWHRSGVPGSGHDDWFRKCVEYVMCFKRPGKLPWANNTAMGKPPKYAPGGEYSHRTLDGSRVNKRSIRTRKPDGGWDRRLKTVPAICNPGNLISIPVGGGKMGSNVAHENEAPFPLKLAKWFIVSCCPPKGVVYDPFCGSGTTGHAAIETGRDYRMSDIRMSEVRKSRRRMREAKQPLF